jgi:hypothetical protein
MKKLIFLFSLAWVANQAFAVAFDVSGIQIGIPLQTQKAAIATINPSYQFSELKYGNGQIVGVEAVAQKNGINTDQFVVLQDGSGIVWLTARAQVLEKGERIKPDIFLDSLIEKYGPYSGLRFDYYPVWQFDRQGNLYQGNLSAGPCWDIFNTSIQRMGKLRRDLPSFADDSIIIPHKTNSKCGTIIWVTVFKESHDSMISRFSVEIIDVKRIDEEMDAKNTAAKNQKQQQLNEEKSKNIKPKL